MIQQTLALSRSDKLNQDVQPVHHGTFANIKPKQYIPFTLTKSDPKENSNQNMYHLIHTILKTPVKASTALAHPDAAHTVYHMLRQDEEEWNHSPISLILKKLHQAIPIQKPMMPPSSAQPPSIQKTEPATNALAGIISRPQTAVEVRKPSLPPPVHVPKLPTIKMNQKQGALIEAQNAACVTRLAKISYRDQLLKENDRLYESNSLCVTRGRVDECLRKLITRERRAKKIHEYTNPFDPILLKKSAA